MSGFEFIGDLSCRLLNEKELRAVASKCYGHRAGGSIAFISKFFETDTRVLLICVEVDHRAHNHPVHLSCCVSFCLYERNLSNGYAKNIFIHSKAAKPRISLKGASVHRREADGLMLCDERRHPGKVVLLI